MHTCTCMSVCIHECVCVCVINLFSLLNGYKASELRYNGVVLTGVDYERFHVSFSDLLLQTNSFKIIHSIISIVEGTKQLLVN